MGCIKSRLIKLSLQSIMYRKLVALLVSISSIQGYNYSVPSGTTGVSCADGFGINILSTSEGAMSLQLIDECTSLAYTHTQNIGTDCYLYQINISNYVCFP